MSLLASGPGVTQILLANSSFDRMTYIPPFCHAHNIPGEEKIARISVGHSSTPIQDDDLHIEIVLNRVCIDPASLNDSILIIDTSTLKQGYTHPGHSRDPVYVLFVALSWYFHRYYNPAGAEQWQVIVRHDALPALHDGRGLENSFIGVARKCEHAGLVRMMGDKYIAFQSMFWQSPYLAPMQPIPLLYSRTNMIRHPLRRTKVKNGEVLYIRHIPSIKALLRFRQAALCEADIETVQILRNNYGTGYTWTIAEVRDDLEKKIHLWPHELPVIASWEPIKFGVMERLKDRVPKYRSRIQIFIGSWSTILYTRCNAIRRNGRGACTCMEETL